MKIVSGAKKHIPAMKDLWLETFPEDTDFVNVFFSDFYKPSKTLLLFDGEKLLSALYWLDVKAKFNRRSLKGAYLYGVATRKNERGAGHFSRLHETFLEKLTDKKYNFVCAIPQNDKLFAFYKKFGYSSFFRTCEYSMPFCNFEEISPTEAFERKYDAYKRSRHGFKFMESRDMFLNSCENHRFLGFEKGYFAFCIKDGKYCLYDVCDPENVAPRTTLLHYERSAVLLDISSNFDTDFSEREKPTLNFLLN